MYDTCVYSMCTACVLQSSTYLEYLAIQLYPLECDTHQALIYLESAWLSVSIALIGSDATVGHPSIIPDIKAEYVEVKGAFVNICTKQGTPTLDEVKEHCIDLIEGVFTDMPRIICHEDDIKKAETFTELARVVCFHLSTWISYDFFKKVIAHFQPALKSVEERLRHYEDQLTPLLQQKLECIAELQQR